MTPSRTALEQAARLVRLVGILPGDARLWTDAEAREARLLVSLLSEHALAAQRKAKPERPPIMRRRAAA